MLSSEPTPSISTKENYDNNRVMSRLTSDQLKELQELQSQYFIAIDKSIESVKKELGREVLRKPLKIYLTSIHADNETLQMEERNDNAPSSAKKRYKRTTLVNENESSIPATPKFNPDLPETPAVLRRAARLREKNLESTTKKQSEIRITRSTIRQSHVRKPVSGNDVITDQISNSVISFELPNGDHVDLDMSAGPEQALDNLSKQGVTVFEMRSKVNEYVNQVRNFFKSLSGYNRSKQ